MKKSYEIFGDVIMLMLYLIF